MGRHNHPRLYVYGSLKDPSVVNGVLGHRWTGRYKEAMLDNFRVTDTAPRYALYNDQFQTQGLLMDGLSDDDFQRLDRYEGLASGHYERWETTCTLQNGDVVKCWVYVAGPRLRAGLASAPNIPQTTRKGAKLERAPRPLDPPRRKPERNGHAQRRTEPRITASEVIAANKKLLVDLVKGVNSSCASDEDLICPFCALNRTHTEDCFIRRVQRQIDVIEKWQYPVYSEGQTG